MISQTSFFSLLTQREYGQRKELDYRSVHNNIRTENYHEYSHIASDERVDYFDVQKIWVENGLRDFVVTGKENGSLYLWKDNECCREYDVVGMKTWPAIVKFVDKYILFSGKRIDNQFVIVILPIDSGRVHAIIEADLSSCRNVVTVGKRIFGSISDGTIREWSTDGSVVQNINTEALIGGRWRLSHSNRHLVHWGNCEMVVHDLENKSTKKIRTFVLDRYLGSYCIKNLHFVYSLKYNPDEGGGSDFCALELNNNSPDIKTNLSIDHNNREFLLSYIKTMAVDENSVYLAHVEGSIFVIDNLVKKTSTLLGRHPPRADFLACEGDILVSGSKETEEAASYCMFWNLRTLKKIGRIPMGNLTDMRFVDSKLFTIEDDGQCNQYDFLVPPKKKQEKIESKFLPEKEEKESSCSIA